MRIEQFPAFPASLWGILCEKNIFKIIPKPYCMVYTIEYNKNMTRTIEPRETTTKGKENDDNYNQQ